METHQRETHQKDPPKIDSAILISAYPRALLFAERKLLRFKNSGLGARLSAEDATHDAFAKVLSGDRLWNPEAIPDLFVHLAGCINSIISNAYSSYDYKNTDQHDPENKLSNTESCSEQSFESKVEFESKVTFIIDFLIDQREDVKEIAELMLRDGITEPRLIADHLNMSVEKVNASKVTIKRIMKRAHFTLHYIAKNRQDLIDISVAIYKHKITSADELSEKLSIPADEVRTQRRELYRTIHEIHRGLI